MKNKILGIIGLVLFIAAVACGSFFNFDNADVLSLALAGFGIVSVVINVISKQKEKGAFTWPMGLTIALALLGGGLVCLGGYASNILETVSGLVLALLAVFLSLMKAKKD